MPTKAKREEKTSKERKSIEISVVSFDSEAFGSFSTNIRNSVLISETISIHFGLNGNH